MDVSFVAPDTTIEQLKCSLCEGYLSVSPISLISEDGNQYKCGRCSSVKTLISTKVSIFEQLAKFMDFPCMYKECDKKLPFADVKDHEKSCEYRTVMCPKSGCSEVFRVLTIGQHFKEKHDDVYHTNNFSIKNVYAYYNIDILEKNGKIYLSFFDFDDINFGVSICSIDPNDTNARFEIQLKSEKSNYSISIANQNVVPFNEREHCFKCVSGNCKAKFHIFRDNRKDVSKRMTTKINRDSVKKMFGPGLLTYTINIEEKGAEEKPVEAKVELKDALIRKAKKIFLQMLECPVCKDYMTPPIYQCVSGHTVCNACKPKQEVCETCKEKIGNTRNYALEELSKKVELPSDNEKKATTKTDTPVKRPAEETEINGATPKIQKK